MRGVRGLVLERHAGDLGAPNQCDDDIWQARFDASCEEIWLVQLGSTNGDRARVLAPDGAGGVFIAGGTSGNLAGANAGAKDPWLARFDGAGNELWARQFGGAGEEAACAACADGAGGVFVTGETFGDVGGPNEGLRDAWTTRYDAAGAQTWISQFGTEEDDEARALARDEAAGAFVAGWTGGDLGGPNAGADDVWLARYAGGCAADVNGDGELSVLDFVAFQLLWQDQDPAADCDASAEFNVLDFVCYQQLFQAGCE